MQLEFVRGRVVDLRRLVNVHRYGYRPHGPMERYELWIRPSEGRERKFIVNTRNMPARSGHDVSVIASRGRAARAMALYNHSADDGVNWARTDAPSLLRMGDLAVVGVALVLLMVMFGEAGLLVFGLSAAIYLWGVVCVRHVLRRRRASRVDWAINALARADFPQGDGVL